MSRYFNFQVFLLYTLISTLPPFLIHNVLNCLLLSEGRFFYMWCRTGERQNPISLSAWILSTFEAITSTKCFGKERNILEESHICWSIFWITIIILGKVSLSGNCVFIKVSRLFNISSFGHIQDWWMEKSVSCWATGQETKRYWE